MEILKSSLKQVPEAERVKGRVYGVADVMDGQLENVAIFMSGNSSIRGFHFNFWFELPESMLPTGMPEVGKEYEFDSPSFKGLRGRLIGFEFELKGGGTILKVDNIRPIQLNPAQTLSIPAGTKAEQLEFLRGVIATMEGGGV
jgi:hypothetical protein